jgi:hypothetical protein
MTDASKRSLQLGGLTPGGQSDFEPALQRREGPGDSAAADLSSMRRTLVKDDNITTADMPDWQIVRGVYCGRCCHFRPAGPAALCPLAPPACARI